MNVNSENNFRIALSEIDDILTFTDSSIMSKIPDSFINFISNNKDTSYISNINPYIPLDEQNLKEETKAIIALIYRSYLASEDEKELFAQMDTTEFEADELQKRLKYNPDDILKKRNINDDENLEDNEISNNLPAIVAEKTLYEKIFSKIKHFFKNIFNLK